MTWTLDELVGRAAQALADVRVANGRVTGVPDGRLIRWYATIGLVDRPLPGPGRGARYGPRHLLQLVAVKRLQAQGRPLVEIQERLTGATDTTLRAIADLPPELALVSESEPAPAPAPRPHGPPAPAPPADPPARFWAARPAPYAPPVPVPTPAAALPDSVEVVHGVRVGGLTLLLSAVPTAADLDAIAAAARPLLDLLAARGLTTPPSRSLRSRLGEDPGVNPTEGDPS